MTNIQIVSTTIIILATIFNVYMTYWKYLQETPVIDIRVKNLPPYKDNQNKTTVILKNVGKRKTNKDLNVNLSCSWLNGVSYQLDFPSANFFLQPNEEISWKLRIDNKIPDNSSIELNVINTENNLFGNKITTWEYHEQIT